MQNQKDFTNVEKNNNLIVYASKSLTGTEKRYICNNNQLVKHSSHRKTSATKTERQAHTSRTVKETTLNWNLSNRNPNKSNKK